MHCSGIQRLKVICRPYTNIYEIEEQDEYIILACDGTIAFSLSCVCVCVCVFVGIVVGC